MLHKIYLITTDVSDEVYVGYTSNTLEWRLKRHISDALSSVPSTRKLFTAIQSIGSHHFSISLLYECDDKNIALGEKEQYYITKYDSIVSGYNMKRGGGGVHITTSLCKPVDMYDSNQVLIRTFTSRTEASIFLNCDAGVISCAIKNADNGMGSQVKGYWVCHGGTVPGYKIANTHAGCESAKKANTGHKRPEHSKYMKDKMQQCHKNYHVPEGLYTLTDAAVIYGRDFVMSWCNNPEQVVSKMMIRKSKNLT